MIFFWILTSGCFRKILKVFISFVLLRWYLYTLVEHIILAHTLLRNSKSEIRNSSGKINPNLYDSLFYWIWTNWAMTHCFSLSNLALILIHLNSAELDNDSFIARTNFALFKFSPDDSFATPIKKLHFIRWIDGLSKWIKAMFIGQRQNQIILQNSYQDFSISWIMCQGTERIIQTMFTNTTTIDI